LIDVSLIQEFDVVSERLSMELLDAIHNCLNNGGITDYGLMLNTTHEVN